ncbi:hypothetical protein BT69DRAFT_207872 [Atractiella rhizophila]|nr:hypothetical protein BT69DRAFT_982118 [Atractiella rhizophila]KAH8922804.1 hypothetical protein BT69DRAFT_207872 [Atractiella rhizophila]
MQLSIDMESTRTSPRPLIPDVLLLIFSYVSHDDLYACFRVSREWNFVSGIALGRTLILRSKGHARRLLGKHSEFWEANQDYVKHLVISFTGVWGALDLSAPSSPVSDPVHSILTSFPSLSSLSLHGQPVALCGLLARAVGGGHSFSLLTTLTTRQWSPAFINYALSFLPGVRCLVAEKTRIVQPALEQMLFGSGDELRVPSSSQKLKVVRVSFEWTHDVAPYVAHALQEFVVAYKESLEKLFLENIEFPHAGKMLIGLFNEGGWDHLELLTIDSHRYHPDPFFYRLRLGEIKNLKRLEINRAADGWNPYRQGALPPALKVFILNGKAVPARTHELF